jgi:hypothetical protein
MATNGRSPKTALKRFTLIEVLAMAIVTLGCSGPSTSAVAPTPAAPPAPNLVRLSGRVDDTAWRPLADVKVEMVDGQRRADRSGPMFPVVMPWLVCPVFKVP